MKKNLIAGLLMAGIVLVSGFVAGCDDNFVIKNDGEDRTYEPLIITGEAGGKTVEIQIYTGRLLIDAPYEIKTGDTYEIRVGEDRGLSSRGAIAIDGTEITFIPDDGSETLHGTWDGYNLTLHQVPDIDGNWLGDFFHVDPPVVATPPADTPPPDDTTPSNQPGADINPNWVAAFNVMVDSGIIVVSPADDPSVNPGSQTIEYAFGIGPNAPTSGWGDPQPDTDKNDGSTIISFTTISYPADGTSPYYAWARSKATDGYDAGTAVQSLDNWVLGGYNFMVSPSVIDSVTTSTEMLLTFTLYDTINNEYTDGDGYKAPITMTWEGELPVMEGMMSYAGVLGGDDIILGTDSSATTGIDYFWGDYSSIGFYLYGAADTPRVFTFTIDASNMKDANDMSISINNQCVLIVNEVTD